MSSVVVIAGIAGGCALLGPDLRPADPPDFPAAVMRGHSNTVTALAISSDGGRLASGSRDGTVDVWLAASGQPEARLVHNRASSVWAVAFSPDSRLLASAANDLTIRIWDVATARERARLGGHTDSIRALAWSPDGTRLASGSRDDTVRLWDTAAWQTVEILPHGNTVRSLAFSADGTTLYSGSAEDLIRAWDIRRHSLRAIVAGHSNTVHALVTTPDGRFLVSGAADQTLKVWRLPSLELVGTLAPDRTAEPAGRHERWGLYPGPEVMALAMTSDGRFVASAHRGSAIRVWDIAHLRLVAAIHSPADTSYALGFAPSGDVLYSAGDDRAVYAWRWRTQTSTMSPRP